MNTAVTSTQPVASAGVTTRAHGGNDVWGQPEVEFSSNANACGPCPQALRHIQQADSGRYPEPGYVSLRQRLASFHGVDSNRILIAASGSEFIVRITALASMQIGITGSGSCVSKPSVWIPPQAYADYAQAAAAYQLQRADSPEQASLVWCCDPSSPLGLHDTHLPDAIASAANPRSAWVVLDRAYEPLRLHGSLPVGESALDVLWQLWTPNKALGLPGIRAAYAIAPVHAIALARQAEQLAASWLLGAHGLAMLEAWVTPSVQVWVQESLPVLREWKAQQVALCTALGFECMPSHANFFTARLPGDDQTDALIQRVARLRGLGVKLREASSFGLPGHARLSVQPPAAQNALRKAWLATA